MVQYYHHHHHHRGRLASIFDSFTLNPLPYPVLLILMVTGIFLGSSWYLNFESVVETAEEQFNWLLLFIPITLLVLVHWLSSMETQPMIFGTMSPCEKRRHSHYYSSTDGGSSPWGVAAFILLLLVLVQFQSTFLDMWF
ncbi:uncharacterized protein [Rutidosis leptorrhynchoides]|uniref:uncharacterized protein n=1 Tax=Rutidosis leptorrhynchoides TaxID=125765 RepID=UPI003A9922B1